MGAQHIAGGTWYMPTCQLGCRTVELCHIHSNSLYLLGLLLQLVRLYFWRHAAYNICCLKLKHENLFPQILLQLFIATLTSLQCNDPKVARGSLANQNILAERPQHNACPAGRGNYVNIPVLLCFANPPGQRSNIEAHYQRSLDNYICTMSEVVMKISVLCMEKSWLELEIICIVFYVNNVIHSLCSSV